MIDRKRRQSDPRDRVEKLDVKGCVSEATNNLEKVPLSAAKHVLGKSSPAAGSSQVLGPTIIVDSKLFLEGTRCRRTRVRQHNCAHKTQNGKMIERSAEGSAESTKWGQIVSPGPPRAQNGGKLCSRRTRILNILFQFLDTIWSMRTDTKAFCVLGGPDAKVTQNTLG